MLCVCLGDLQNLCDGFHEYVDLYVKEIVRHIRKYTFMLYLFQSVEKNKVDKLQFPLCMFGTILANYR